jgi:hypothetical protein
MERNCGRRAEWAAQCVSALRRRLVVAQTLIDDLTQQEVTPASRLTAYLYAGMMVLVQLFSVDSGTACAAA